MWIKKEYNCYNREPYHFFHTHEDVSNVHVRLDFPRYNCNESSENHSQMQDLVGGGPEKFSEVFLMEYSGDMQA